MNLTLELPLRIAGAGLILLAVLHIPIGRHLKWREDSTRLTPANASIFRVHIFFICLILLLMGVPCLIEPQIFLEKTRAGTWLAWSFSLFWAIRLYAQWFIYPANLWRGKRLETVIHWSFSAIWLALATVFALSGLWQIGWRP